MRGRGVLGPLVLALALLLANACLTGCWTASPPSNVRRIILRGDAYERGLQHGQAFKWDIRSLYTRLLTNSIIPMLNQEHVNIAPVLGIYFDDRYQDGQFSYQLMLESADHLWDEGDIPETYKRELQGIADGAEMPLAEIKILNTFMDTMLAFRGVALFIQDIQKPKLRSLSAVTPEAYDGIDNNEDGKTDEDEEALATVNDGVDNDDDGKTDEEDDGLIDDYESSTWASLLEVPTDATIRIVLRDTNLPGEKCLDPENIMPVGEWVVDRECAIPSCISPACGDSKYLSRGCFPVEEHKCLSPRVPVACLVPLCVRLTDPACVDRESVRIQMDETVFTHEDEALVTRLRPLKPGAVYDPLSPGPEWEFALECQGDLEVLFTPPGGLPPASAVSLLLQVQDRTIVYSPAPVHARGMRDERITITTAGYFDATGLGAHSHEVASVGADDGRSMPMPVSFAARGSATTDGAPIAAHHYALLDGNLIHEHAVVFVQIPEEDEGMPHAYLGYAGLAWGFNGINSAGMTYQVNHSDSLDNPLVGGIIARILENLTEILAQPDLTGLADILTDVKLTAENLPLGFSGREILSHARTVDEGLEILYRGGSTFGWNWLLADAEGDMLAVETDGATDPKKVGQFRQAEAPEQEDGFRFYGPEAEVPENLDPHGRPWASVGPDDLRISGHFVANEADAMPVFLATFTPRDQRRWSPYYFRAARTWHLLGQHIDALYGSLDVARAIALLRSPDLVDERDSMNAVVFEPARGVMHWAIGEVPATELPFIELDLKQVLETGVIP